MNPRVIVCDEAVSALDVSIQGQVINLLEDLQQKLGLTYLFIAHDFAVVRHISTRVAVMYLGRIVEQAPAEELFATPQAPLHAGLAGRRPIPDPAIERARPRSIIKGELPSPLKPPAGCVFHPRCPLATEECKEGVPATRELAPGTRWRAFTREGRGTPSPRRPRAINGGRPPHNDPEGDGERVGVRGTKGSDLSTTYPMYS